MTYQTISFLGEPGKSKFPGLIYLPLKAKESDGLFHSSWGANMIRPTKTLSSDELKDVIQKSREILLDLRKEFPRVVLIDFQIQDELPCDIDITWRNHITPQFIEPVLKNLEFSNVKYTENGNTKNFLAGELSSIQMDIHAFSCAVRKGAFAENYVPHGARLFEETKIFASLAMKGEL